MDETKPSNPSPEKPSDKDYKKKKIEEIGSTLAQIKARVKASRSCARKEDDSKTSTREILSEKSEKYIQVLELDKAKAQKLEKDRPKMKEAIENLMIDRENQKIVEKRIEETRAKQSAPLPEIPVEVQKRISDLEITIHNLKETLSEKERILDSKSESWKLLSDQLEQRNIEVVERYEVMSKEIDQVKKSYADQEIFLRSELEKCKVKLQEADSQLISQENLRREQEENGSELDQLKQRHSECESKFGEMQRTFEAEKKLCLKLKAQIKNYRNQINSKKDLTSEVERLQNQIATLEEDKESSLKNEEKVSELEKCLSTMESELISIREQRDQLNNDHKELCAKLNEKEECVKNLTESLEKMEQSKISSEFKAAELEEKLEAENKEDKAQNDKMCKEIDNLKQHVKQQERQVEELKSLIFQKEEEISALKDNKDMEYSFAYDTQDLKDLLDEWKSKYSIIEESVRTVEEEKETLSVKLQTLQADLDSTNERCSVLIEDVSNREAIIEDYVKKNNELMESLRVSSEKIIRLENELRSEKRPESKNEDQTQKLKKLAANLKIKVKLCKELEEKVSVLNEKLIKQEHSLISLAGEKAQLENIISEYKMKLENVSLDTEVVEQLKNLLSEKEVLIQQFNDEEKKRIRVAESTAFQRARKESQSELVQRDTTIKHLKEENLILESKLNENMIEIHSVEEAEQKPSLSGSSKRHSVELEKSVLLEQVDSSLLQIKCLTQELELKGKIIQELEKTVFELNNQLEVARSLQEEMRNKLAEESKLVEVLKNELNQIQNSQEYFSSDISSQDSLLEQIKTLQNELDDSKKKIGSKEELISRFEREMSSLKTEINQNEAQLEQIQELYVNESSRNDGVITNIQSLESELELSKNEILGLSEQLGQVSSNYKSCLELLKEKDVYIDKLEKELSLMRDKLQSLQSTIEERHKAMEEQARKLGDKLNAASEMGSNFEQYRSDMEHKMAKLEETEKHLNARIKDLLNVNGELELDKKVADERVNELESELGDIKSAYNATLDQIEILNVELNQVMAQIEHRNRELVKIGEERNSLVNRLSELENTCSDLRARLQVYEEQSETLKSELDCKLKELDLATSEITNLQTQLCSSQLSENTELNKELEVLKTEYEERLRELQVEKEDLLKVIKGGVESEVDSLMKAAEEKVEKKEEIQLFSWGGHAEKTSLDEAHDEGWGWNASEAKLEEEYQNSEANKTKQLEEEKDKLKANNEKLEEEVKILKIKCTKLIAKVKELKTALEKTKGKSGFEDLDFAMQEELRSQVDEVNKINKEFKNEISSMKIEKERLMKRIETLTSANNQLIEMKERQDIEVQVWQRNCTELKTQLQTFDWNESEVKKDFVPLSKETGTKLGTELEDKLTFLETENEQLLQIICSLKDEKHLNDNLLSQVDNLKEENQKLKQMKQSTTDQNEEFVNLKKLLETERFEIQKNVSTIDQLINDKNHLESQLESLKSEIVIEKQNLQVCIDDLSNREKDNEKIKSELDSLKIDSGKMSQEMSALKEKLSSLEDGNEKLNCENSDLNILLSEKDTQLSQLKDELSQLNVAVKHIESLQSEQSTLSNEIVRLKSVVETLTVDNETLRNSYNIKVVEMDLLKADMKMLESTKEATMTDLQTLRDELSGKSDNADVQDGHQVHSASSLFDTPVFTMSNVFAPEEPLVRRSVVGDASSPFDIPSSSLKADQFSQPSVAESPPVFRGFLSDQNDPFAAIQQQFQIEPHESDRKEISKISAPIFPQIDNVDLGQLQSLKQKVVQLEEENFSLVQTINESRVKADEGSVLAKKFSDKDNEIIYLKNEVDQLNLKIKNNKEQFEMAESELLKCNQEHLVKISELERTLDSCRREMDELKRELHELKTNRANETEKLKCDEDIRQQQLRNSDIQNLKDHYEGQILQNEMNFKNALLDKEEENSHLVCQVSAKQALCDRLTAEIESIKFSLNLLENDLKLSKEEINSLKQDSDRLNLENNELKKWKEADSQQNAQIDYLQASVQEKETTIDSLKGQCNQLSEQVITIQEELRASLERSSYLENCYTSLNTAHTQQTSDYQAVYDRLRAADEEIERLNLSLTSLTTEVNQDRARLEQEKSCNESLRNKEADQARLLTNEIEALQSTITEKDFEIERLSQLLTGLQEKLIKTEESKISDEVVVMRKKLDQALYTLHLRDTKCEELTLEIMHLLGERDSLQLRLSDTLRILEGLKESKPSEKSVLEHVASLPETKSSHDINNKMGELQTGYMKDPTVRVDRENRHSQQMHLYTSSDSEPPIDQVKKQESTNSDFGILNWFFSSSTSPQPSQEPTT